MMGQLNRVQIRVELDFYVGDENIDLQRQVITNKTKIIKIKLFIYK